MPTLYDNLHILLLQFYKRSQFYFGLIQNNQTLLEMFSSFVLEDYQFQEIWEIKSVKFKVNFETKYYEAILGQSHMVYDVKGNPEIKGTFILTNLRIIWHAPNDKNINISIGLDTIHKLFLRKSPICNSINYLLIINAIDGQARYQFKFSGFTEKQQQLFTKSIYLLKQITKTKQLRDITISSNQIKLCENEQTKSIFENCQLEIHSHRVSVIVTLTNARIIIMKKQANYGSNYGIPWLSISSMSESKAQYGRNVKIVTRLLPNMILYLGCKDNDRFMLKQMIAFGETYSKHPFFGVQLEQSLISTTNAADCVFTEVQEITNSNVNIVYNNQKNYSHKSQKGSINDTQFNDQLGIMMQKHSEGLSRTELWRILKQ